MGITYYTQIFPMELGQTSPWCPRFSQTSGPARRRYNYSVWFQNLSSRQMHRSCVGMATVETRASTCVARLTRLKKITLASVAERNRSSARTTKRLDPGNGTSSESTCRRTHAYGSAPSFSFLNPFFPWLSRHRVVRSILCLANSQANGRSSVV